MSKKAFTPIFTALVAVTGVTVATAQSSLAQNQDSVSFMCKDDGIQPVTKARTPVTIARGPIGEIPVIYWTRTMGGLTPKERCEQVSNKFDRLHKKGDLEYITSGYMDGQPAICTANSPGSNCEEELLTLSSQDNPREVLNTLLKVKKLGSPALLI
ncbi:MAG: hypothetical protein F6K41_11245 [Symploca sp. SIO3E6]|nr:hypothetical protein [Caldora sp. SIO3E6]